MPFYQTTGTQALMRRIDWYDFCDPKTILAKYSATLLLGNGVEFKHKNKKIHKWWHEFMERNRFLDFMYIAEQYASLYGQAIVTINVNGQGEPIVNLANPFFSSAIGRNVVQEDVAVLYERFTISSVNYIIRSTYDTKKVTRSVWNEDQNRQVQLFEFNAKIPKDQQIQEVWHHNLGFCPVFTIDNYPFRPFFYVFGAVARRVEMMSTNPSNFMYDPSSVSDSASANGICEIIKNLYRQYYKEMIYAKSRVIVQNNSQLNMNMDASTGNDYALQMSDFLFSTNGTGDVKVQQNTNKLGDYQGAINDAWIDFFNKCRYSIRASGSAQKTSTESNLELGDSIETTNFKRKFHGECWKRGIVKIFAVKQFDLSKDNEDEWSFEICKNISIDQASLRDNLIKDIQVGADTAIGYIAKVNGVDYDQAENIWDDNKAWFKKQDFPIAMKEGGGQVSGVKGASPAKIKTKEQDGGRPDNGQSTN